MKTNRPAATAARRLLTIHGITPPRKTTSRPRKLEIHRVS